MSTTRRRSRSPTPRRRALPASLPLLAAEPVTAASLWWAARPWSLPASLVPAALAAVAAWPRVAAGGGPRAACEAAAAAAAVALVHAGGNLLNTYFDWASGLDVRAGAAADDRSLVDGRLPPAAVLRAGIAALAVGAALCARAALALGSSAEALQVAWLPAAALVLAAGYTAGPLALKRLALGDAAVAAAFGPLLMLGVAVATTRTPALDGTVLALSLPVALLTANILHANNARDARADAAAGCITLAGLLGHAHSTRAYAAAQVGAYLTAAAAAAAALAPPPGSLQSAAIALGAFTACVREAVEAPAAVWLVAARHGNLSHACPAADARAVLAGQRVLVAAVLLAATLPAARALARDFARGGKHLRLLPQASAQFAALVGAALIVALMPRAMDAASIY